MNASTPVDDSFDGEMLRTLNEKLLIASVHQHELADIATHAEQRLSALVNGLDAVICEISVETGAIIFLSEQAESVLGYDRSSLSRRGFWRRMIYTADRAKALLYLYETVRLQRTTEHEFRIVTADGRLIWIDVRAVFIASTDTEPRLLRCVIIDVSERKKAERIIQRSEHRFRRLFEAARDGILLLDSTTGVITHANPLAAELLGYPHGVLIGRAFSEIGLFPDRETSDDALTRLQNEHAVRYENLSLSTPSGIHRTVELVGNLYRENGITVIQCHLSDVTKRRQAEILQTEALKRERRITEFLQRPLRTHFGEDAFSGLSLAALYEPAMKEAEVGGDFFDAFRVGISLEDQRTVLCVGDVMGKGLQAAALAARIKEVLHAFVGENPDPADTLFRLNNYLCNTASDRGDACFGLTLCVLSLAIVDAVTCSAEIAAAGAEPAMVLRTAGKPESIQPTGMTLGVRRDETYTSTPVNLEIGDTLVMTTDGLTEARRGKALLGYEGLVEIAVRNYYAKTVSEMGHDIVRDARDFCGTFNDDVCILLARCRA